MQFPAGMQAWAAELQVFAQDLRYPLGGLVHRLAAAIGPLAVAHSAWDGEPDGFDGLARRGPYDRLLASEWLLADEVPDEFVRRAAMSEHVFLRLARPEPAGDRLTVALFDAGPSQMGAPRLVHLALLVLLARRAEAARARFGWGIAQAPDAALEERVDEDAVVRLLEARTPRAATADDLAAWSRRIGASPRLDECWWIGGAPLHSLVPGRASRVVVGDVLEPAVRRVDVRVEIPGRLAATVPLTLPDDAIATRLLRDPAGRGAVLVPPIQPCPPPGSNLVFSSNGTKLFARHGRDSVLAYVVPNSPRMPVGPPRVYATHHPIVAVGRRGRLMVTASSHGRSLFVQTFGRGAAGPRRGFYEDPAGGFDAGSWPDAPLRHLWVPPGPSRSLSAFFVDREQRLYGLVSDEVRCRLSLVASGVRAAAWWDDALLVAERARYGETDGVWLSRVTDHVEPVALIAAAAERVLIGCRGRGGHDPTLGPIAYTTDGREWRLMARAPVLIAPAGTSVLGVARRDPARRPGTAPTSDAGLLLLEADQRTFALVGIDWQRTLVRASAPIEQASVDMAVGQLAFATRHELVVCRLDDGAVVSRQPLA